MYSIKIEPTDNTLRMLEEAFKSIGEGAMPMTQSAMDKSLGYAQNVLSNYAAGNQALKGVGTINEPFSPRDIHFERHINGTFGRTLTAESKKLSEIQNGKPKTADFDMKTKYPYGNKSRVSKKGTPYLIIPFRWGTPNGHNTKRAHFNNFIEQKDYETSVKPMSPTFIQRMTKQTPNFQGVLIDRMLYADKNGKAGFADRIQDGEVNSPISKWSKLHYSAGMVRMGNALVNGKLKNGSTYWTFRIITPFQPKDMWVRKGHDAVPAVDIETAWCETVRGKVLQAIEKGIKADLGI